MGWEGGHLHQFEHNRMFYGPKSPYFDEDVTDFVYDKVKLTSLLKAEKEKLIYTYDFGDNWDHTILLEKVLPAEAGVKYPLCIKGVNNCPPEDCGGVWGYASMLEILQDPKHEEYEDTISWVGENFDPKHFDIDAVNKKLGSA